MGLDASRARLFRGRAENIAAAATGWFQHPEIETKDETMSGKIKRFKNKKIKELVKRSSQVKAVISRSTAKITKRAQMTKNTIKIINNLFLLAYKTKTVQHYFLLLS